MKENNKTNKIYEIKLVNGVEMNKKYPKTFFIPSEYFLTKKLKIGSIVKISDFHYSERFWVCVLEFIDENTMICEIRNDLYGNQPYDFLDKIIVKRENIIGYEHFTKKEEIDEEKNEELFLKTENKWKDFEYHELLSKSDNINSN